MRGVARAVVVVATVSARAILLVGVAGVGVGVAACKGPMAKIDAVREALESDDASRIASAIEGYPACADAPPVALLPGQPSPRDSGCLADIANALGSKKGFSGAPVDQAAATAAAIVLLRDGRGDWLAHADTWLGALKNAKGPGVDTLRLAVARKMAEAAPRVGRPLEADEDARAAMKAVAGAIPGACPTYWLVGAGVVDAAKLPAEHSADHAACVHKDLGRREGPGGRYGAGTFRALEGSLSLWRETERALRQGLANAAPSAKKALESQLGSIEAASRAIATKKMESASGSEVVMALGDMHADAGVILWRDAGAGGGAGAAGAGGGAAKAPAPSPGKNLAPSRR